MKVTIVFEFKGVEPDSPEADDIVESLTRDTVLWSDAWGTTVYVDEVEGEAK